MCRYKMLFCCSGTSGWWSWSSMLRMVSTASPITWAPVTLIPVSSSAHKCVYSIVWICCTFYAQRMCDLDANALVYCCYSDHAGWRPIPSLSRRASTFCWSCSPTPWRSCVRRPIKPFTVLSRCKIWRWAHAIMLCRRVHLLLCRKRTRGEINIRMHVSDVGVVGY